MRYRANSNDSGSYYYYAHNTRGDIVGIYNADGSLHAKYSYDVWGNPLSVTDASNAAITSQTDIANLQSFRYRGYYYDSNSGFYYLQSRYYDPVTHRFINADGLVSTGTGVLGYNMYAYALNNPVSMSDSLGSRPCEALSVNKEIQDNRQISCAYHTKALVVTKKNEHDLRQTKYNVKYDDGVGSASYTFTSQDKLILTNYGIKSCDEHLKKISQEIIQTFYKFGMPKLTDDQAKQWYGEIKLHFYGCIGWDLSNLFPNEASTLSTVTAIDIKSYLSRCTSVELDYRRGSVDDIGHDDLSDKINVISKILGGL